MHVSYEESKTRAWRLILALGVVTITEVFLALLGKGYISPSVHLPALLVGGIMVIFSAVKAYYIVKEYMHMGYEVRGLAMSVVLPMLLLVWAIIAFLWEGQTWGNRRSSVNKQRGVETKTSSYVAPQETPNTLKIQ